MQVRSVASNRYYCGLDMLRVKLLIEIYYLYNVFIDKHILQNGSLMQQDAHIRHLEAFVIDNPLLDELETTIAEFNIFEALGAVRQELRHSDFLGFLLNPSANHGLDDHFLKRFLMRVLSIADTPTVNPIIINITDLSNALVERETQNIDILISDTDSKIVCIIENKIFSDEHSNQLDRYLKIAQQRFPNAEAIIPVFLTPDGVPPQDENSDYIPFSYGEVAEIVEQVRQTQESMIGADVNTMMRHYVTMLRRHIVSDSDVAELCRQIYQAHKSAIDLIVEHMPDVRQDLANYLIQLVENTHRLTKVRYSKSYVDFMVDEWGNVPEFIVGNGWANSDATIAIEFYNAQSQLNLYLELGPVPQDKQYIREAIFAHANANRGVFRGCSQKLSQKWTMLYKLPLLRESDYEDASIEDLVQIIEPKWHHFLNNVLPEIHNHLMSIKFNHLS